MILTQTQQVEPYLADGSERCGRAEGVFVAESEKEIIDFLKSAHEKKMPVTFSGGRTGLSGAASPDGGWVLSTERLNRILEISKDAKTGNGRVRLGPGVFLKDLDQALLPQKLFYPPDPTGPKALLGGTISTNASGPNSFKYGQTRRYVQRLRMVLAGGEVLDLSRGKIKAVGGSLEIPTPGRTIKIKIPHYVFPKIKHAGGYFAESGMEAIDLLIGSEGTLGVITEIELNVLPRPDAILAYVIFLSEEEAAWKWAAALRERKDLRPRMIEYFDSGSLDFLRGRFSTIPPQAQACLFIEEEIACGTEAEKKKAWQSFFTRQVLDLWEAGTSEACQKFREFRSALPLAVRDFLKEHHQVKIGTDTVVPFERLAELLRFHRSEVEKTRIRNLTFGHLGDAHVHLNLLPVSDTEAEAARRLYPELIHKAMALGGTFSGEHGAGKLKRRYLSELFGPQAIEEMRQIKQAFDPNLILGRGNLFDIEYLA